MILSIEDFGIIFMLLTPVYALAYTNLIKISEIDVRISQSETLLSELRKAHNYNHGLRN